MWSRRTPAGPFFVCCGGPRVADGAIGTHLQKLEAIGYIVCTKRFIGRRPNSSYELTEAGREALFEYLRTMQRLIDSLMPSTPQPPTRHP